MKYRFYINYFNVFVAIIFKKGTNNNNKNSIKFVE